MPVCLGIAKHKVADQTAITTQKSGLAGSISKACLGTKPLLRPTQGLNQLRVIHVYLLKKHDELVGYEDDAETLKR